MVTPLLCLCFNSMKVRLKHQYEDIKRLRAEFQFHEGPKIGRAHV